MIATEQDVQEAIRCMETARASLTEAHEHLPVGLRERVRELSAEIVGLEDTLHDGQRAEAGAA